MQTDAGERSVHDLGGVTGYGPVPHDPAEPPFHADWEKRVFGLLGAVTSATARRPGEFRYALERLHPDDYFKNGYFGRWLAGFEVLLDEYGVVSRSDLALRMAELRDVALLEAGRRDLIPTATSQATPARRVAPVADRNPASLPPDRPTPTPQRRTVRRELADPPRFNVGDHVVAAAPAQPGHTRLPGYAENKLGIVVKLHPAEVLPDSTAHNRGERPQHVYCVGYDAQTLWGDEAEPNTTIHVDLYECYLTAVKADC
ncbi:nitrile hydratase subunit beta [Candidatus Poriferisodalis multihospitum]|uniref:nitrile hydratase subunit beta n=1 Tax=Candidatus Poriferisodalis multihospitum TaxID=2983191 RepID=UPI002B259234|nr:nitrile hydratase subunit beta [Candidatus Poriferisodalis multihospitum]